MPPFSSCIQNLHKKRGLVVDPPLIDVAFWLSLTGPLLVDAAFFLSITRGIRKMREGGTQQQVIFPSITLQTILSWRIFWVFGAHRLCSVGGIAMALSGGGIRAAAFDAGVLWLELCLRSPLPIFSSLAQAKL